MNHVSSLGREFQFALRERSIIIWALAVFLLSSLSIGFGIVAVSEQRASIEYLKELDEADRTSELATQKDWGSAAYYSFHLTYSEPSNFAFAAMGQRDNLPWKHRLRMLALEGQIYEHDSGNPVVALLGRFDFSFFVAFIVPLILALTLYDTISTERTAGRYNLLEASTGHAHLLWLQRFTVKTSIIYFALACPLFVGAFVSGSSAFTIIAALSGVLLYVIFWAAVCYWVASWQRSGSFILMSLLGTWVMLSMILPSAAKLTIDKLIHAPDGSDILLLQRQTVNDAWDLPREATFKVFFERYPEWVNYESQETSFEWQWYYAFQQVGDQGAEVLSKAYREARMRRDKVADITSIFLPPSFFERRFESLANTNVRAAINYEDQARDFHAQLKAFYYPRFFQNTPFDKADLEKLPVFKAAAF